MDLKLIEKQLNTIAKNIGMKLVQEKHSDTRHDFMIDNALAQFQQGEYNEARQILENYISITFFPKNEVFDHYTKLLKKVGGDEAAEQYKVRKDILLKKSTESQITDYMGSIGSKEVYEDPYLYDYKRFLHFLYKKNDPGPRQGVQSLFSDFISLTYENNFLGDGEKGNTNYKVLLMSDHKYIPQSILMYVGLNFNSLDLTELQKYIYSSLEYSNIFYSSIWGESLSNHDKAYQFLQKMTQSKEEKLYFLLRRYFVTLGSPKNLEGIQKKHLNQLSKKISDMYQDIDCGDNELSELFQTLALSLPELQNEIDQKKKEIQDQKKKEEYLKNKEKAKAARRSYIMTIFSYAIFLALCTFIIYIVISF